MALALGHLVGHPAPPFSQREKGKYPLSLWERVRVRDDGYYP
jgi:hypothetical protein